MSCVTSFSFVIFSVDLEYSHKYSHTYPTRDSRQFLLFKEYFTKSVGSGRFSAITTNPFRKIPHSRFASIYVFQRLFHQIYWAWAIIGRIIKSYVTDWRTEDELIWGGLGNLRFLRLIHYCTLLYTIILSYTMIHYDTLLLSPYKPRGASPGLWWYRRSSIQIISIGNDYWGPLNQKRGGRSAGYGFTIA